MSGNYGADFAGGNTFAGLEDWCCLVAGDGYCQGIASELELVKATYH